MLSVLKLDLTRLLFVFLRKVILLLKLMASGGVLSSAERQLSTRRGRDAPSVRGEAELAAVAGVCVRARGKWRKSAERRSENKREGEGRPKRPT